MAVGTQAKRFLCAFAIILMAVVPAAYAEDDDDDDEGEGKNWMVMVGAVGEYAPEFVGSDEHEWGALPLLIAKYEWPRICAYIEGDELGLEASPFADLPLSFAAGVAFGQSREENCDPVLDGTGDIGNPVQVFGEVSYGTEMISANAKIRYAPLQRDSESFRHAFLYDINLESEVEAIPFILRGEVGATIMDGTWSSLYYDEGAGLESAHITLDAMIMLAEHFGLYLQGDVTRLLGNAASSSVSIADAQYSAMLGAFVTF